MRKLAPVAVGAVILVVSHLPHNTLRPTGLHYTVEHALAYGLLTCACLFGMRHQRALVRAAVALAVVMAIGAMDELTQPWFGRQCGFSDWLFNLAGACLAIGVWLLFRWCRRLMFGPTRPRSIGEGRNAPGS